MREKKIRIAMVDDHVLFREGLRDLLESQKDFQVVAEGGDGQQALTAAADKKLDVLLIDLRMPTLGGVPAIRRLKDWHPNLKIVVISMYEDQDHRREAIVAGADAYLSKMDGAGEVVRTIRRLMQGELVISADERRKLTDEKPLVKPIDSVVLTESEHRIMEGLCRGKSNRELSGELCVSERTIKNHLNTIFRKMGVKTRLEAVMRGIEKKMISFN